MSNRTDNTLDNFMDLLRRRGHRVTYERRAIMAAIAAIEGVFDAPALMHAIAGAGEKISRASVYNTLGLLLDNNFLRKLTLPDGRMIFHTAGTLPGGNLLQAVCTHCGNVKTIKESQLLPGGLPARVGTFTPSHATVTVYGTCSRCQRKQRRAKS